MRIYGALLQKRRESEKGGSLHAIPLFSRKILYHKAAVERLRSEPIASNSLMGLGDKNYSFWVYEEQGL